MSQLEKFVLGKLSLILLQTYLTDAFFLQLMCIIVSEKSDVDAFKNFTGDAADDAPAAAPPPPPPPSDSSPAAKEPAQAEAPAAPSPPAAPSKSYPSYIESRVL